MSRYVTPVIIGRELGKKPRSPSQKAKAENELIKLERLEANLNEKLYRLGSKARDRMQKIQSYKPKGTIKDLLIYGQRMR